MIRTTRVVQIAAVPLMLALLGGCAGKKKEAENEVVPFAANARYAAAIEALQERDLRKARRFLEGIELAGVDNRSELEPLVRVALADATFYQGHTIAFIDARSLYLDFVTLYSDHGLAPYAAFQAGICSFRQMVHASKDQSQTLSAINDFREVQRRYPESVFADAAERMVRKAEKNLAEHEFLVGRFYLKRKSPLAAVSRFRRILDRYPEYREKEKLYYHLGQALLASNNPTEGAIYLDKLIHDFPNGQYVDDARKALSEAQGPAPQLEVGGTS